MLISERLNKAPASNAPSLHLARGMASTHGDTVVPCHDPTSLTGRVRTGPKQRETRANYALLAEDINGLPGKVTKVPDKQPSRGDRCQRRQLSYFSVAVMLRGFRDTHTCQHHYSALYLLIATHCN